MLVSYTDLNRFRRIEDVLAPDYYQLKHRLNVFAEDYNLLYAYFWRYFGDGIKQYIVDNDFNMATQITLKDFEPIEEDAAIRVLLGYTGVTDLGVYFSDWESLISAYAPVFDNMGNIVAIAGVDISDEFLLAQRADAKRMKLIQLIVIPLLLIFAIINMLLYHKKALKIQKTHTNFKNGVIRAFLRSCLRINEVADDNEKRT